MSVKIPCPHCGRRPYTEFTFGGEFRWPASEDPDDEFARVYHRANVPEIQRERWFHALGCRRWVTLERHVGENRIDGVA